MDQYTVNAENMTGAAIGDNAKVYNTYYDQRKPDFFLHGQLDNFKPPYFPSPENDDKLKNLDRDKVLIIGGDHEDKPNLALHIAYQLQNKHGATVWGWNGTGSPQSLFADIRGEGDEELKKSKPNIIILPDLQPQYNLREIQKAAEQGNNYVIATTDVPIDKWIVPNQSVFWDTSTESPTYNPEDLAEALIQKLNDLIKKLNDQNTDLSNSEQINLSDDLTKIDKIEYCLEKLQELLKAQAKTDELKLYLQQKIHDKLTKVAEIEYCLEKLQALLTAKTTDQATEIERTTIDQAIDKAIEYAKNNREDSLKQWFNSLDNRDKLLVLGLSFFDGLFEDQFFAALETVVRDVWQQRDPTLKALDYQDLANLGNYYQSPEVTYYDRNNDGFKVVKTENHPTEFVISQIILRNSQDRQKLLKVAWTTHRRQIMNALEAIVNIVKESVEQQSGNWELYGNEFRRNLLHDTVSQTIYEISLGEKSAASEVRTPLLKLASNENIFVKDVAAKAIAQWYINGVFQTKSNSQKQRFFGTIAHFWRIATQKQGDTSESQLWREHIGATVAMAISYAAVNCSSYKEFKKDFLKEWLILEEWLKELSEHPSQIIRSYFGHHTLFYLVPIYFDELKEHLKEWTQKHEELNYPIAVALSLAYKEKPQGVKTLLNNWREEAEKSLNKKNKNNQLILANERLLATVVLTYGEIGYDIQSK